MSKDATAEEAAVADTAADELAVATLLAQRWGPGRGAWQSLADVRPLELATIITGDAEAVVALLAARRGSKAS